MRLGLPNCAHPLEKAYRNTVYCCFELYQDVEGRIRGKYCGNRWCMVCNRVRTGRAIANYEPVIRLWRDPQFVTLTIPNVPAGLLPNTLHALLRAFPRIARGIRRTDRLPFKALRKLEVTYNRFTDTYHPHFHLVVEGRAAADALLRRWLASFPEASEQAQDIRPCDEVGLRELFKYFTKLTTRVSADGDRQAIPLEALDTIFQAMRGRRVYQPMGFRVARTADVTRRGTLGPRMSRHNITSRRSRFLGMGSRTT